MNGSRWILTCTALAPAAAMAHPGHGALTGMLHGLEPVHALPLLALIAFGGWVVRRARKAKGKA